MTISVEFRFEASNIVDWVKILEGLTRGETGAVFQDRMDVFGEAVSGHLEDLLERWPGEYFLVSSYGRKGDAFQVEFVAGPEAEAFAEAMWCLLETCGVTDISCRGIDLSGD
jgi:hypothetical protein